MASVLPALYISTSSIIYAEFITKHLFYIQYFKCTDGLCTQKWWELVYKANCTVWEVWSWMRGLAITQSYTHNFTARSRHVLWSWLHSSYSYQNHRVILMNLTEIMKKAEEQLRIFKVTTNLHTYATGACALPEIYICALRPAYIQAIPMLADGLPWATNHPSQQNPDSLGKFYYGPAART